MTIVDLSVHLIRRQHADAAPYWVLSGLGSSDRAVGEPGEFSSPVEAKMEADKILREHVDRLGIEVITGPVWSNVDADGTRFIAECTVAPKANTYQVELSRDQPRTCFAHRAVVTDGGALVLLNDDGQATAGFSPTAWTLFRMTDGPSLDKRGK